MPDLPRDVVVAAVVVDLLEWIGSSRDEPRLTGSEEGKDPFVSATIWSVKKGSLAAAGSSFGWMRTALRVFVLTRRDDDEDDDDDETALLAGSDRGDLALEVGGVAEIAIDV